MHPAGIRAVVTDLDGTIVRRDGTISAATIDAARALRVAGIPLVVATARTQTGLDALAAIRDDIAVTVCCNGSLGIDRVRPIWRCDLASETVTEIVAVLAWTLPGTGVAAFDGRRWRVNDAFLAVRGRLPMGDARVTATAQIVESVACTLAICHPELSSDAVAGILIGAGITGDRAGLTYAARTVLDVAPPGVTKATGVARALATLGVDPQDVIAFGDAPNDLPMFGLVGHPVAVANAHPSVLAATDMITDSVTDDGFARLLATLGITTGSRR